MQRFTAFQSSRRARGVSRRIQAAVAAAVSAVVLAGSPVDAAGTNTPDQVISGQTDLSNSNSYSTPPTTTSDVEFSGTYTGNTTFNTNGTALGYGTLNDLDTTDALIITNNNSTAASISLNTASNSLAPNAADLLYVASGGNLSINNTTGQGALTLSDLISGNVDNAGTLVIGTAINLNANTLTFTGAGTTTLNGVISGTGGLIFNTTGSVTVKAVNTLTGAVVVNSGTVYAGGPNSNPGDFGSASSITINSGGTINVQGYNSLMGPAGNGTIVINAGGILTETGNISEHLGVVKLQGGTIASPGADGTYGSYNLDKGVISGGTSTTSVISAPKVILTQSGGTVFNVSAGTTASGIDLDVTGTFYHVTGAGDNGLIKTGNGVMALAGANTYTSATTVNAGTLLLDFTQATAPAINIINNTGNNSTLVLGGGTFKLNGSTTTADTQQMKALTVSPGASSIILQSNGQPLLLTVGAMTGNGGTVDFTLPAGAQTATNGIVTTSTPTNGIFPYATVGRSSFATVNSSGDIIAATTTSTNVPSGGLIPNSATGNVQIIGGFPGAYTGMSGNTAINSLTDSVAGPVIVNPGPSTLTIGTGGLLVAPGDGPLFLGTTPSTGALTAGTGSTAQLVLNNNSSNNLTVNSVISNNGSGVVSLASSGTASVTLNGANTFTGTTSAGAAGLILANSLALQNSTLASGNIVFSPLVTSNAFTVGGLTSNFTQALTNSAGTPITLTFGGNGQSNTFSGTLTGAGTLVKTGSGTETFNTTTSTYTGGLVINQGTVISTTSGGAAGLGVGTVTVNAGGILQGNAQDSFGYTSGQAPTIININGGIVQENTSGSYRITLPDLTFSNGGQLNSNGDAGDASGQFSFRGNPVSGGSASNITVLPGSATSAVINATTIWMQATNTYFNVGRGTAASDLILNSSLNNAGNFFKTGNGIMTLTDSTTFSGVPSVNGGELVLDFTSSKANPGGILNLSGSGEQYLNLGGGTVVVNGSKTQAVTQSFYTTDLTAGASGIDVISNGQSVYVPIFTIQYRNSGTTIDFVPPSGASSSSNGINDVLDQYTLTNGIMGGFATVNQSDWATIDGNANVVAFTGYNDVTAGAVIPNDGTSNVRINGSSSGTLTLQNGGAGNTNYINSLLQKQSSAATIDTGGGQLVIGSGLANPNWGGVGGVLMAPGSGALTIGVSPNSGTVTSQQGSYANGSSGGELIFINNSANPLTVNSTITDNSGPIGITTSGSGLVVITGTSTNTGPTAVNGGTMQVGAGGTTGNLGSGAITLVGNLAFDRSDNPTVSSAISGTGSVIQNGTGTLTLKSNNSFTGGLIINSGTVLSTTSGSATAIGGGPVTVNTGGILMAQASTNDAFGYASGTSPAMININGGTVTQQTGTARTTLPNLTFSNGGTLTSPNSGTNYSFNGNGTTETITVIGSATSSTISNGTVGVQRPLVINVTRGTAASDLIISSVLSNFSGAGVTINGNGIVTLTNGNTFTGGLTIKGGTVISTHNNGTGNGPVTVNTGAVLEGNGSDALNYGSTLTINGGTVTQAPGAFRDTLPNIVFGNGGTINAPSNNTGDSNNHNDNYSLYGGTVTVNASPYASNITGGSIGLQDLGTVGGSVTFNVSRGSAPVDLAVSSILTDFSNPKGLLKTGTGFMSVTAPNTYTVGTTVTGGLFLVNNTSGSGTGSGPVAVNSGAALAGTGSISGNTTVNAGGVISAGSTGYQTTGTLSLPGATTLASGSGIVGDSANGATYLWKINDAGNSTGPGTAGNAVGWDLLAMNTVAVSGTGSYVTIEPVSLGGGYVNLAMSNFNPMSPYTWQIASLSGGGAPALAAQLHLDTNSLSTFAAVNNTSASDFSITDDANNVYISYSPAPEPTSLALLGVGAAGILLRRRRGSRFGVC